MPGLYPSIIWMGRKYMAVCPSAFPCSVSPVATLNQNIPYDVRFFHTRQTLIETAELESKPAVVDT